MAQVTFENNANLEKLLTTYPDTEKRVRKIVKQVIIGALGQAKNLTAAQVKSRKEAEQAVRAMVYKKILGGGLTILPGSRKAGNRAYVPAPLYKLETETNSNGNHRGGNRMKRSQRTWDLLGYQGKDRGFILRFLNTGTPGRSDNGIRNVGQISGRNWFPSVGGRALDNAAEQLELLLGELITKEFNKK